MNVADDSPEWLAAYKLREHFYTRGLAPHQAAGMGIWRQNTTAVFLYLPSVYCAKFAWEVVSNRVDNLSLLAIEQVHGVTIQMKAVGARTVYVVRNYGDQPRYVR